MARTDWKIRATLSCLGARLGKTRLRDSNTTAWSRKSSIIAGGRPFSFTTGTIDRASKRSIVDSCSAIDDSQFGSIPPSLNNPGECDAERNFFRLIWSVAFLELLIAIVYILMAVFGFSVPVLIGVAGACVYTLMAAGLYGLKLHIDTNTGRIISALQLLAEDADDASPKGE